MGSKTKNSLEYDLGKISSSSFRALDEDKTAQSPTLQEVYPSTKITVAVPFELLERIRDYAHWEGMTQKETVLHALEGFFEENKAKRRPEAVIKRAEMRMRKDKRRTLKRK